MCPLIILAFLSLLPIQEMCIGREAGGARLGEQFTPPVDAESLVQNDGLIAWFYPGNLGYYNVKVNSEGIVREIEQFMMPVSRETALDVRNQARDLYGRCFAESSDDGERFTDVYEDSYTRLEIRFGVECIGDDVLWLGMKDIAGGSAGEEVDARGLSLAVLFDPYGDAFPIGLAGINLDAEFNPSDEWTTSDVEGNLKSHDYRYGNGDLLRIITDASEKIVRVEYVYQSQTPDLKNTIRQYLIDKYGDYLIEEFAQGDLLILTFRQAIAAQRTRSLVLSCLDDIRLISSLSQPATQSAAVATAEETPQYTTNSIGMKMRLIEAGSFLMGTSEDVEYGPSNERPAHTVRISKAFYIGVYEVTQSEYERVMGTNPSRFDDGPNYPVEFVSWYDANEFCERLSAMEGVRYRLPTEAEWEYACRAGTTSAYYWGDSMDGDYAWYHENSGRRTQPVGLKKPNAWGLHDMNGNVSEWCYDKFKRHFYSESPEVDPTGPTAGGGVRVIRGGDFIHDVRSASRLDIPPQRTDRHHGFRVVREIG